jgi:shikimate dehydrogenase
MRLFGLIGYPLSHSFSKGYFSHKFQEEAIGNCQYDNFPLEDISLLPDILKEQPNLVGLNVTIPYKEKVIPYLNEISTEAREIGAVNTIRISREGNRTLLKGFNTDVYGFMQSLQPLLKQHHESALVLGTGGASKAVIFALKKLGISYKIVSRQKLPDGFIYTELNQEVMQQHTIIINTTPLGTFPKVEELPPLPYQFLTPEHLLYDLVYNPAETAFLKQGLQQGCTLKNGLEMLHLQAEKAWSIWNSHE